MISRASSLKSGFSIPLYRFSPQTTLALSTIHHSRRTFKSTSIHHNSPQPPPSQDSQHPEKPSFKPFQRAFFKVFLGAIFTYQVWYWAWTKLEMDDLKAEKQEELSSLEKKARDLASKQS